MLSGHLRDRDREVNVERQEQLDMTQDSINWKRSSMETFCPQEAE